MTGWLVTHFRASQSQSGRWVTPLTGDAGYVDITLAKGNRVLFLELKSDRGYLSDKQKVWRDTLSANPNVEYGVLRPRDWEAGLVEKVLLAPTELPQK